MRNESRAVPATKILHELNADVAYTAESTENFVQNTLNLMVHDIVRSLKNIANARNAPLEEITLERDELVDVFLHAKEKIVPPQLLELDGDVGEGLRKKIAELDGKRDSLLSNAVPA